MTYMVMHGLKVYEKQHKECYKELEIENKVHESKHRELSEWDYNREESNLKKRYEEEKKRSRKRRVK